MGKELKDLTVSQGGEALNPLHYGKRDGFRLIKAKKVFSFTAWTISPDNLEHRTGKS